MWDADSNKDKAYLEKKWVGFSESVIDHMKNTAYMTLGQLLHQ